MYMRSYAGTGNYLLKMIFGTVTLFPDIFLSGLQIIAEIVLLVFQTLIGKRRR